MAVRGLQWRCDSNSWEENARQAVENFSRRFGREPTLIVLPIGVNVDLPLPNVCVVRQARWCLSRHLIVGDDDSAQANTMAHCIQEKLRHGSMSDLTETDEERSA